MKTEEKIDNIHLWVGQLVEGQRDLKEDVIHLKEQVAEHEELNRPIRDFHAMSLRAARWVAVLVGGAISVAVGIGTWAASHFGWFR